MIGRILGNYRIVEQIGMGGMATVYKAYEAATDRYVALKTLPQYYTDDPKFVKRFQREAKALARLEHPFILPIFSYGEEDGITYLVMRYMPTGTLKEHIEQGIPALNETSAILSQIADALDYAHECGILHRDVKPSNVLLDHKGNAYLTDFGIAKIVGATVDLTGGGILGTPAYMSPEQCQGKGELSPASDEYALGVILYEAVTGQTPFQAETPLATVYMHLHDPLPPPSTLRPDLPEAVERVILKALAKDPEARFESCGAMAQAFAQAIEGIDSIPITELPAVTSPHAQTFDEIVSVPRPAARRSLPIWAWGVIGAFVIAGLVGGAFALGRIGQGEAEQAKSQDQQAATSDEETVTQAPGSVDAVGPTPTVHETTFAVQVGEFADPILAAIVDREPEYEDDFGNPSSGWRTGRHSDNHGSGESGYRDGEYFVLAEPFGEPGEEVFFNGYDESDPPEFVDFVLEIDGRIATPEDGFHEYDHWELRFRDGTDTYGLRIYPNTDIELVAYYGDEIEHLTYDGDSVLGVNETNHVQIIALGPEIAVYVNEKPVAYWEDNNYATRSLGGAIQLMVINGGEQTLEACWDNLRIWDISELVIEEEPILEVRNFVEPILGAISGQSPDFEDDFGNPGSGWDVGIQRNLAGHEGEVGYDNGVYFARMPGVTGEQTMHGCGGFFPGLVFSDFVLEIDGRFATDPDWHTDWHITFRNWWAGDPAHGGKYMLTIKSGEAQLARVLPDADVEEGEVHEFLFHYVGGALTTGTEWNHFQIVAQGAEIAVYANGEPIIHVVDPGYMDQYSSGLIGLTSANFGEQPLEVQWDNLRIWDISDLETGAEEAPVDEPTPVAPLTEGRAAPILETIATLPPDFEDEFSTADPAWRWHSGRGAGIFSIEDGVGRFALTDDSGGNAVDANHPTLVAKDFVLQLDVRLTEESGMSTTIEINFRNAISSWSYRVYLYSAVKGWSVKKEWGGEFTHYQDGTGHVSLPGEFTQVVIVAQGPDISLYLNGALVAEITDDEGNVEGQIGLNCWDDVMSGPEAVCEYDNIRFWNLENLP